MIYKVLDASGESFHGGSAQWSLPTRNNDGTWTPGEWMPEIQGDLVACENGYHLCEDAQVMKWLGPAIYEAEYDGEIVRQDDKIVVRRARLLRRVDGWNDDTARQLARWCALSVAHLWDMPAIVREYLETGNETLRTAVWSVAWGVARDAAWTAASAAARAAAWDAAWTAARDAAWGVASAAAWTAASAAARTAAWDAQYEQFIKLIASGEA